MKQNLAHHAINALCRAAASRVGSCVFAFSNGVRYFSELFYYSYYYFRNAFAICRKRRCAC